MNAAAFNWPALLTGVQFLLGVQLIVVAVLHFIYRSKKTAIPLGFLCLIHGLWFFKRVFTGFWEDDLFLFLLIGPGKPIFVGAVLLFYYRSYSADLKSAYVLRHLWIPGVYYLLIILFRFALVDHLPAAYNHYFSFFFTACVFLIFWHYFLLTRREIQTNVQVRLIPKAYKKVKFLFYSLYFFLLQVPIWDMFRHIVAAKILPASLQEVIDLLYYNLFLYVGEYAAYTYLHLLGFVLFLFAISEIAIFKRLFLPEKVLVNQRARSNRKTMDQLIAYYFGEEKIFKNPNLSLHSCAQAMQVNKNDLVEYFVLDDQGTFKDFVNRWRVNEFKGLILTEGFGHYDLVGLAKECGFQSKSTFFRVFKQLEGITPNQYKKNHQQLH